MNKIIRAFFAIPLARETKDLICSEILPNLQQQAGKSTIRWTRRENLHITLQFQASISFLDIAKMIKNVQQELETIPPFEIEWGSLHFFPSETHPKIISLSMGPENPLQQLAQKVGAGIQTTGYPIETRPYRPHLTLCRLDRFDHQRFSLDNIVMPRLLSTVVSDIVLYQSEPSQDGSHYREITKLSLKKVH